MNDDEYFSRPDNYDVIQILTTEQVLYAINKEDYYQYNKPSILNYEIHIANK